MGKTCKAGISLFLCACILLLNIPVQATETVLTISDSEQFLAFAENCRLDTYSQGLQVKLTADLDLSGLDFEPIPIFSGDFDGNGHRISGLHICATGSNIGLFRYVTETATVENLYVEGSVQPEGSRSSIGAIAGMNSGKIRACFFTGTVIGADQVGGLVGVNTVTGMIEQSGIDSGSICGNHFTGGIAGKNAGVIRECYNKAAVNETVQQNSVDISDITIDTITNAEAVNTVTDIGGIAGISTGVIRSCQNSGTVGYPQIGYNIGGIAGSQSGYILECTNTGTVSGRKEVGGIVGQMEPVTYVDYSTDTLQILKAQLGQVSALANSASANAQNNAADLQQQLGQLQQHTDVAKDAVDVLLPDPDDPTPPDPDSVAAAQNNLASSLGAIPSTMEGITNTAEMTTTALSRDLLALSAGINSVSQTLNNASENLGGTISDVSDADTENDLTGKVDRCINFGAVFADLNGGGIAGAMSFENDLDPEADILISGDLSLNFDTSLRCVILNCTNQAAVTVKKSNIGGIVGWQSMGLVKLCTNTGTLDAQAADNAGGIAGSSAGYIRSCNVKCHIEGNIAVGGIAGIGAVVTDCRSMTQLQGAEQTGSILGIREDSYMTEETPIRDNYYFVSGKDPGAIDGISYAGSAQGLAPEAFLALEGLSQIFTAVTVVFTFEDGTREQISLTAGGSLPAEDIPAIPQKEGFTAHWEGLPENGLEAVYFDTAFCVVYTPLLITLPGTANNQTGTPIFLAQGQFPTGTPFITEERNEPGSIAAYNLVFSPDGTVTHLRWLLPEGYSAKDVTVQLLGDNGWQAVSFTQEGSYLVFPASNTATAVALYPAERNLTLWILAVALGTAIAVGGTVTTVLLLKRKKERANAQTK